MSKLKVYNTTLTFQGPGDFTRKQYRAYVAAPSKAAAAVAFGYGHTSFNKYASEGGPDDAIAAAIENAGKVTFRKDDQWCVR